jgi:hypothetical protein
MELVHHKVSVFTRQNTELRKHVSVHLVGCEPATENFETVVDNTKISAQTLDQYRL